MRKIISILFLLLFSFVSFAEQTNPDTKLPVDKTIRKGVLPNGMTYYIKHTDFIKGAASYYIMQNVGSILENENQRGLAHFLEHMAFNGTKHFKGKEILNTLQRHGAVFGREINAYTGMDETVYNLSNIVTKDNMIDTCLMVLKDWANYLLLTDEEIDAERGVIKEEWRTRQTPMMRIYQKSMPTIYNKSKYAERSPIGLMSVVEGFKYKALRDFYHDWYRTDLQAISVIGDIDIDKIETKIKSMFSEIPAVETPRERIVVDIPDNKEILYFLAKDPEVSTPDIKFNIRSKKPANKDSYSKYRRYLLLRMANLMLNERFSAETKKLDAPFLSVFVHSLASITRNNKLFSLGITPKPKKQKAAFELAMKELIRAVKFGFVPAEINRTVKNMVSNYEAAISKKDDLPHIVIQQTIQADFFENEPMIPIEKEYEIAKEIFASITPEQINSEFAKIYTKDNRSIIVVGVEGENNLTKAQVKQTIDSIENSSALNAYKENFEGKKLLEGVEVNKGSIVKEIPNKELGSTTFVLSNGIKVHYKFVDKEKDHVSLQAISYGGKSLVKNEDLPSATIVDELISSSGLGNYSATDLPKVLAGKTASVSVSLRDFTERLSGSSTVKDVETMLQLVHLYFVKPRFDKKAWQVLQEKLKTYITSKSKNINNIMSDSLTLTLYGRNNPRELLFNKDLLKKLNFETAKSIYKERFGNAADFEFFIVGDVKKDKLKPILSKYTASIPTNNVKENFKDWNQNWVSNKIDKDIYLKMEVPKSRVYILSRLSKPYSPKNILVLSAFSDIMQLRITEKVREDEGGAYSPSVGSSLQKYPRPEVFFYSYFDCNPDKVDKLAGIVYNEIKKIADGYIKDDDFSKTKANYLKDRVQAKNKNRYYMGLLTTYYRYGYNKDLPKNFTDIVKNMTKKDIQNIAKEFLSKKSMNCELIFKPLK